MDLFNQIPNTSLRPEESFSKEIGLKYRSQALSAEVFYFHTDYEGFIDRATVCQQPDGTPIKQRRNMSDAEIQGMEASTEFWLNPQWRFGASPTWTEGRDAQTKAPLRRIPPLYGSARLVYYPTDRVWLQVMNAWAITLGVSENRFGAGWMPAQPR